MTDVTGSKQVTLVSHYGEKPAALERLIGDCQEILRRGLGERFEPYALAQVHGTVIGLEGERVGDRVEHAESKQSFDPVALLDFVRNEVQGLRVQIGGYRKGVDYGFTSRGRHPSERSFSLQNGIAVVIGWPVGGVPALDRWRRQFELRLGVRHKYHASADAVDNDFFFVVGRVEGEVGDDVVEAVRAHLASTPVVIPVGRSTLRIVAYEDTRLPLDSSVALAVDSVELTAECLLGWYPSAQLE